MQCGVLRPAPIVLTGHRVERDRDLGGGFDEEVDLVLAEVSRLGGVDVEGAGHLAEQADREAHRRQQATLCALGPPPPQQRVLETVVADEGTALEERLAHRSAPLRVIVGGHHDVGQVTVVTLVGHRDDEPGDGIVPPDPGHPKSAGIDEDRADLAEDLAPRRTAHDGTVDLAEGGVETAQTFVLSLASDEVALVGCVPRSSLHGPLIIDGRRAVAAINGSTVQVTRYA